MLSLTRTRKFRISNRLAGIAALLLVVTSLSGYGISTHSKGSDSIAQADNPVVEEAPAFLQSASTAKAKSNKGFKMSLFLFRNK